MTPEERDQLQNDYVQEVVDGMDMETMYAIVYDSLNSSLDNYSIEELIIEVKEYYPHLLDK